MPIKVQGVELQGGNISTASQNVHDAVIDMGDEKGWTKQESVDNAALAQERVGKFFGQHRQEDLEFTTWKVFAERLLETKLVGDRVKDGGADKELAAAAAINGQRANSKWLPDWVGKKFSSTFDDRDPDIYAKTSGGEKDESATIKADVLSDNGLGVVGPPSKFDKRAHTIGIFKLLGVVAKSHGKTGHSFIYRGEKYTDKDIEKVVALTGWAHDAGLTAWVEDDSGKFVVAHKDEKLLRQQLQ
ncbi:hypothetical protein QMZ92_06535 [Streptomyces sp. HNM0645]|uniref:hypothetical protein n=1 Tax=Streptomyces sp. HNM0645 TaxID=2782343 RepID=UPI0024B79680|nr:hypothetical protein [Streptomyces sp. HNM0645]MDI9884060.1 hypothetical protein [Streptomyces sp. HNM0645]